MINKKTLAVTAFALLLSQQSFANETEGLYFGSKYYGQFFNDISKLTKNTQDIKNVTINGKSLSEYKANYSPLFAANIVFGYTGELGDNSYRAELEGMYSSVKADNVQVLYTKKANKEEGGADTEYLYGTAINHDQVKNAALMANVYHYWKSDNFSFSPYIGAGVGGTRMTMFGKGVIKPAGQLKAGLDYRISEDVNMHIGYRGFFVGGVVDNDFTLETEAHREVIDSNKRIYKELVDNNKPVEAAKKDKVNIKTRLFHTHGIEAGLTFHFASKA